MRIGINWLAFEAEIRSILEDSAFEPEDALACIDETLARYTKRGNSRNGSLSDDEYLRLANQYPQHFAWG
jgi:hypothetical protein